MEEGIPNYMKYIEHLLSQLERKNARARQLRKAAIMMQSKRESDGIYQKENEVLRQQIRVLKAL